MAIKADERTRYLASREWALKKEAVRERSKGYCERCGVGPHEATHHKTYANVGNEALEDLQAICNQCHEFVSAKSDYDPAADLLFLVVAINKTHIVKNAGWTEMLQSEHARLAGKMETADAIKPLTFNPWGDPAEWIPERYRSEPLNSKMEKTTMTTKVDKRLESGNIFEHAGHLFRFAIEPDQYMNEPWKEDDCHGPVSEWTDREPAEGERRLATQVGRRAYLYYDFKGARAIALRDGWASEDMITQAVQNDFERLRAWCDEEWHWVGVVVTMLKRDEDAYGGYFDTKYSASLWGIDGSDQEDYLSEVGYDLAAQILDERR